MGNEKSSRKIRKQLFFAHKGAKTRILELRNPPKQVIFRPSEGKIRICTTPKTNQAEQKAEQVKRKKRLGGAEKQLGEAKKVVGRGGEVVRKGKKPGK
ncbi:MAG: hypothetical protein ACI4UC_03900 [Alloprevotella sp.]